MSSNNEKSTNFEKVAAFVDAVTLLASGAGGVAPPSPDIQTQKPNYSIVEQQKSEAQKRYESLPKISKTLELEEQLETRGGERESEQREKRDNELETSLNAESMAKSSGSPDPEPENEEGEYVSEYMKDLESRLEAGTLTLKSPEEQSESELSESETESESEYSEWETESASESHSEMKWG
jgi:hypothetical protein